VTRRPGALVPASPDPGSRPPTDEQIDAALHIREMIAARAGEAANVIEETAEPVTRRPIP
jgi:hypothetical protein